MSRFTVGREGFSSRAEAEAFSRKQGIGFDAIRGEEERVDVIDRESNQFVAKNIPKSEAEKLRRGSPSFTIAPAGSVKEPRFSFSPDVRGGKPVTTETSPETGATIQITGATQEQIEQQRNVEKAIAAGRLKASQRESLREQILNPERFKPGRREEVQRQAERASKEVTAGGLVRESRKLPEDFQTPQTLRSIAESGKSQFLPQQSSVFYLDTEAFERQREQQRMELSARVSTGEFPASVFDKPPVPKKQLQALLGTKDAVEFVQPKTTFQKAEEKVSEFLMPITLPAAISAKKALKDVKAIRQKVEKSKAFEFLGAGKPGTVSGQIKGLFDVSEFGVGAVKATAEKIGEKPLKSTTELGVTFGVGAAFGAVVKGSQLVTLTKAGGKVAKVIPFKPALTGTIKYGLPAAFGAVVTAEVATAPTLEAKGAVIGKETLRAAAFIGGAKFGETTALKTRARVAEIQYEMALEGRLDKKLPVLSEGIIPDISLPRDLSTQFLVSELKGVKRKGIIKKGDIVDVGAEVLVPIKSDPFRIDIRKTKLPDAILARTKTKFTAKAERVGVGTGRTFYEEPFVSKLKSSPEELPVPKGKIFDITSGTTKEVFLTPKEALQFGVKRKRFAVFPSGRKQPTGITETLFRESITGFTPVEFATSRQLTKVKGKPSRKKPKSRIRIGGKTFDVLEFRPLLPGFEIVQVIAARPGAVRGEIIKVQIPGRKIIERKPFFFEVEGTLPKEDITITKPKKITKKFQDIDQPSGDTVLVSSFKHLEQKTKQKQVSKQKAKQKQKAKLLLLEEVKVKVKVKQDTGSLLSPLVRPSTRQKAKQKQRQKLRQKQKLIIFPELKSFQSLAQTQIPKQKAKQRLVSLQRLKPELIPRLDVLPRQQPKQDIIPLLDTTLTQKPVFDIPFVGTPPKPGTTKELPPSFIPPPLFFPKSRRLKGEKKKKKDKKGRRPFRGTPSLSTVGLGELAAGVILTKKQLAGKALISPFTIRKISNGRKV